MCGICGIVPKDPDRGVDAATLSAMRDALRHRGPDDAGLLVGPGVGLAARRLAILDLTPRGHMPMVDPQGRFWIVYNGEIYNYRQLRSGLESRGHRFVSQTDTEVVLRLYADEGPAMLERLDGMFAFAIWDNRDRRLLLARDRLGIKPLYYTMQDDTLYFASEAKAFWRAGLSPEFDPSAWEELLCFRFIAGEATSLRGIRRLLPGHLLTLAAGQLQMRRWWHLAERVQQLREQPPVEPVAWLRQTLDEAVTAHRVSDVPLGLLLSGGLDSGSLAASLSLERDVPVTSFTMRFVEPGYDEGPVARSVAEACGLPNRQLWLPGREMLAALQEASGFADEPLVHGNEVHLLAISRFAKTEATVLFSGEGADELFGGYARYRPLALSWLPNSAGRRLGQLLGGWPSHSRWNRLGRYLRVPGARQRVLVNACEIYPDELREIGMLPTGRFPYRETILDEARQLYPEDFVRQAMYLDQHTYLCSVLDRSDRMTMAASIECRVPFLDHRLVEGAAALPTRQLRLARGGKPLLRQAVGHRLPRQVLRRRKLGFSAPFAKYLREEPELREMVAQIADLPPICDGPFDRARLRRVMGDFLAGDGRFTYLVRQLVMTAVWYQNRTRP